MCYQILETLLSAYDIRIQCFNKDVLEGITNYKYLLQILARQIRVD